MSMMSFLRFSYAAATLALLVYVWLGAGLARADAPAALPTAPGADRALEPAIPSTAALASLPGGNGSPLEPYLFGFLFVGGGIIGVVAVKLTDRYLQNGSPNFDNYIIK